MVYEISREIFKQKLLDRSNMLILQISGDTASAEVPYKEVVAMKWTENFSSTFSSNYPNKNQSYLLYAFDGDASQAKKAAECVAGLGYPFVYYYQGHFQADSVLDKGIN